MRYFVDIDGTICTRRMNSDYEKSEPLRDRIEKLNRLYDDNHEIVYWTARGSVSGIDWYDFTKNKLSEWGVKYHKLIFGKPSFDLYVDDKNLNFDKNWSVKILKILK